MRAEGGRAGFGIGGRVRAEVGLAVLAWVDWCARRIGQRLVNGCARRMGGPSSAWVDYQGVALLRLYLKMLLLGFCDIFEALQNRKKLKLLQIVSQMF